MGTETTPPGKPGAPAIPGVTRWQKKRAEAEAIQRTAENTEAIRKFAGTGRYMTEPDGTLRILVSSGWRRVEIGWWVGREGRELFVDTGQGFAHNYEPAPGPAWKARAEAAEAQLAEIREVLAMSLTDTGDELGVLERPADDSAMLDRALRLINRLLAIIGAGQTQEHSDGKEPS